MRAIVSIHIYMHIFPHQSPVYHVLGKHSLKDLLHEPVGADCLTSARLGRYVGIRALNTLRDITNCTVESIKMPTYLRMSTQHCHNRDARSAPGSPTNHTRQSIEHKPCNQKLLDNAESGTKIDQVFRVQCMDWIFMSQWNNPIDSNNDNERAAMYIYNRLF